MAQDENEQTISIDGSDYKLSELTDAARAQISNIQFVDARIQQLDNEWAVSDTARMAYANALKNELSKIDDGD